MQATHTEQYVQALGVMLRMALQVLDFASFSEHGRWEHESMRWLPESANRLAQAL